MILHNTLLLWMWLSHFIYFSILTYLVVRLYLSWKKRKRLNSKIVHFIQAVYDLQKPLELIKKPLEEIAIENNLEDANKNKLRLAIWSASSLQKTVNDLIEQEKTDKHFQSILESYAGKKAHLKEKITSKIKSFKLQKNELSINNAEQELPKRDIYVDQIFMEKLMAIIKIHLDDTNFSVDILSQKIGMSRSSLYHRIRDISGQAPADFIRQFRLERAMEMLKTRQYNISEVAFKTGFSDVKYFRTVFKKQYKSTPGNFLKDEE